MTAHRWILAISLGALLAFWIPSTATLADDEPGAGPMLKNLTPERAKAGWGVFFEKRCVACHALWGEGGQIGSDLGRVGVGKRSSNELAATMWNHIPEMGRKMEERGFKLVRISEPEMEDLFAFFFFLRFLGEPGNPEDGGRLFSRAGCAECHEILGKGGAIGPDLVQWGKFANPVVWAQKMWEAAPAMEAAMKKRGMRWPEFQSQDIIDLAAYLRSVAGTDEKVYLRPGNPSDGRKLFQAKGCSECHTSRAAGGPGPGPDLSGAPKAPGGVAELAVRMWNHAPAMGEKMLDAAGRPSLTAQEMTDLISYLLALRFEGKAGDVAEGKRVFKEKQCERCHNVSSLGSGRLGPSLAPLQGKFSPALMAHVMWRVGPQMLDKMLKSDIPWPHFTEQEMRDLTAYLNASK